MNFSREDLENFLPKDVVFNIFGSRKQRCKPFVSEADRKKKRKAAKAARRMNRGK